MDKKKVIYADCLLDAIKNLPEPHQDGKTSIVLPPYTESKDEMLMGVRVMFKAERLGDSYCWTIEV